MSNKLIVTCVIAMLTFLAVLTVAIYAGELATTRARTEQMKACVAAGKTWVRDGITSYYECK